MTFGQPHSRFPAKAISVRSLSEQVIGVQFEITRDFTWSAGQYVEMSDAPDKGNSSYYSIASAVQAQRPGVFELAMNADSIKFDGGLEVGRTLWVQKPGGGIDPDLLTSATDVILIGMGTGIAPLRAMAQQLLSGEKERPRVILLQGSRRPEDCLFFEEFSSLQDSRFDYRPVLSAPDAGWTGRTGRVGSHLDDLPVAEAQYCICGSLLMVEEVSGSLRARGVPQGRIFSEGY